MSWSFTNHKEITINYIAIVLWENSVDQDQPAGRKIHPI